MSVPTEQTADATLDLFDVHGESASPPPQSIETPTTTTTTQSNTDNNAPLLLEEEESNHNDIEQDNISKPISKAPSIPIATQPSIPSSTSPKQESSPLLPVNNINDEKSKDESVGQITTSSLPFKASAIIRSLSDSITDKIPHQINSLGLKPVITPKPTPKSLPNILSNTTTSPVSSNASSPQPPYGNNKNLNMTLDKFSKEDLFKLFGKARKENRVLKQQNESLTAKNRDLFKALNASNEQNEVLQITNQHLREEYNALKTKSSSINTDSLQKYEALEEELRFVERTNEEKISLIKTQSASYMDEINRLNEQIDQLKTENDKLQRENENVQTKIGDQYSEFMVQINALKQTINEYEDKLNDKIKEKEQFETEIDEIKQEITNYQQQIGRYKEIARKAEANLDRIESLEEELRDKIRDNHQLQIKNRSLTQNIKKITEKHDKQNEKIQQLQEIQRKQNTECNELKTDNISYKENNKLLNEKLNILLKENADHTLKTEKQIENIENYHLSKYKTLLKSFQMMKKRIEVNNKMNNNNNNKMNKYRINHHSMSNIEYSGYSNQGWKKYHDDHNSYNFNLNDNVNNNKHLTYSIDLEMDEEEYMDNMNNLNNNIKDLNELSTPSSSFDEASISSKYIRKYQNQVKEYKQMIYSLQKRLKEYEKGLEIERNTNKKIQAQNKRLNKPQNVNIDYLRNVLVKFLILSEYLTDEQIVLVPVLGSILSLTQTEKDMIDNSYNTNRYFMGTNTLFPENANAKHSPQKKKKKKKKKKIDNNITNLYFTT